MEQLILISRDDEGVHVDKPIVVWKGQSTGEIQYSAGGYFNVSPYAIQIEALFRIFDENLPKVFLPMTEEDFKKTFGFLPESGTLRSYKLELDWGLTENS